MVGPYWKSLPASRLTGVVDLKLTDARPIPVNGATFRLYRSGGLQSVWMDDDGNCEVRHTSSLATYRAWAGDKQLPQRFRRLERAMAAALASLPRKEGE